MIAHSNKAPTESLAGTRILVVEDEMVVAMVLEDLLVALGCTVVKAARVDRAVDFVASGEIDAAILDVNVAGEPVYPVAHELRERGIPFIFSSGYGASTLTPEYRDRPTLSKPFHEEQLAPMLAAVLQYGRH